MRTEINISLSVKPEGDLPTMQLAGKIIELSNSFGSLAERRRIDPKGRPMRIYGIRELMDVDNLGGYSVVICRLFEKIGDNIGIEEFYFVDATGGKRVLRTSERRMVYNEKTGANELRLAPINPMNDTEMVASAAELANLYNDLVFSRPQR